MKSCIGILLLCLSLSACRLSSLGRLPISESSGLWIDSSGSFYTHNDGGNSPLLYELDQKGRLQRSINILAPNVDWEALATDSAFIYLADMGNNLNQRQDLCIYFFPKSALDQKEIQPQKISFYYPEQIAFPAASWQRHFDAEALFTQGDSLYIVTKNRHRPHDGWHYLYALGKEAGPQAARLCDSVQLKKGGLWQSVTAAAYREEEQSLYLLSMRHLYRFSFERGRFGPLEQRIRLPLRQQEALCFGPDAQLYLTTERSILSGAKLWRLRPKALKRLQE
ncbi:hypothetical protein [Saprospira grandis]|uniref:hypothetical protein n=1 Tax=Saprospira grandis TaxID=1008 RepID=UPI0022DD8DB3|nr:hypothetical protein [Saprospira grandis]WBM75626.1 hypothetical protein OP864_05150 [Saprospira grandis]